MEIMHRFFLFLVCWVGLFAVSSAVTFPRNDFQDPSGDLHVKKSRGMFTGAIPFGYAIVVLLALALFLLMMGIILCYKSDKGSRKEEKTIFLTRF